jgi:hypothetical protein
LANRGPARVAKPEKLRRFVKCLTRRIVDGFTKKHIVADATNFHNLCMTPAHEQGEEGEGQRSSIPI